MEKVCPICQTVFLENEPKKTCEECKSEFHIECWSENGGCATYGCKNAPKGVKKESEQFVEQTFWGARTKICPMCGEIIKIDELRCPYCNEQFDTIEPIAIKEIKDKLAIHPQYVKENKGAVIILICGMLGITAPFNLLFGGIWYKQNRKKLQDRSPIHNLLAIVGLTLSVFYLLLFVGCIIQTMTKSHHDTGESPIYAPPAAPAPERPAEAPAPAPERPAEAPAPAPAPMGPAEAPAPAPALPP